MLTPEIALLAGTAGVFLALVSCLVALATKRRMNNTIKELRLELDAHLSASHEMAKHLRALQRNQATSQPEASRDELQDRGPELADYGVETGAETNHKDSAKEGLSLAEKLGLSQSEADIITHLRPRKQRFRETV